jgi:hypothetical protein
MKIADLLSPSDVLVDVHASNKQPFAGGARLEGGE